MYDERIGDDVRKVSNYFYDEIVRFLAKRKGGIPPTVRWPLEMLRKLPSTKKNRRFENRLKNNFPGPKKFQSPPNA